MGNENAVTAGDRRRVASSSGPVRANLPVLAKPPGPPQDERVSNVLATMLTIANQRTGPVGPFPEPQFVTVNAIHNVSSSIIPSPVPVPKQVMVPQIARRRVAVEVGAKWMWLFVILLVLVSGVSRFFLTDIAEYGSI
jgi:hypothetical protein